MDALTALSRRFARTNTLMGAEGRVRAAVRRGVTPLRAYERYGAF